MRKRTHGLLIYFTKSELDDLRRKAEVAGLSCSAFVRRAVENKEIRPAPSVDVPILIRDIRRAGHNVNELLKLANTTHLLDAPQMRKVLTQTYLAADAVVKAFSMEE